MDNSMRSINVPGLEAIYMACRRLYPDQPNPLQVTAVRKYWLGGPDPLDYISMYAHMGNPSFQIPPHWHYVSFGLSDLHGDGRVHEFMGLNSPSGFGFELTFRLKREPGENSPPTWPAALLQALARYVFQTDNIFVRGDHVPWHSSLDGSESRIQHILMTEDPQLQPIQTPNGTVNFVQVVGVTVEELKAAQQWNGPGVLDLLKDVPGVGGPWCVTDMRRGENMFELDPNTQEQVEQGIMSEGSNLSGVTSQCAWEERAEEVEQGEERPRLMTERESAAIKEALKKGLARSGLDQASQHDQCAQFAAGTVGGEERKLSIESEGPGELLKMKYLDSVHMKFDLEAGQLLPLALKGRLKHGRHFTFKSALNDVAVTLVTSSVTGAFADEQRPLAAHGSWLHVLVREDVMDLMMKDLAPLEKPDQLTLPHTFRWSEQGLFITITPNDITDPDDTAAPDPGP